MMTVWKRARKKTLGEECNVKVSSHLVCRTDELGDQEEGHFNDNGEPVSHG